MQITTHKDTLIPVLFLTLKIGYDAHHLTAYVFRTSSTLLRLNLSTKMYKTVKSLGQ